MPDFKYEGTYPRVFPYELGAGFEVTPAEGNPAVGPVGSTVYLSHGDILHAKEPIEHAWLKEVAPDAPKKAAKVETPTETATTSPETPVESTEPESAATAPDATAEVSEASDQPAPPAPDVQPK